MQPTYAINEIFYSLQGEGVRAGTPNVFVRFAGCNLTCSRNGETGFDCDTEFMSSRALTKEEILAAALLHYPDGATGKSVIFTGGEPALQLDQELVDAFKKAGFYTAIETNGTRQLPVGLDWICVSPKTAEHTLVQPRSWDDMPRRVDELKYVRHADHGIPKPSLAAVHHLPSPAFSADVRETVAAQENCVQLVKQHPTWRLSVQLHKLWTVR